MQCMLLLTKEQCMVVTATHKRKCALKALYRVVAVSDLQAQRQVFCYNANPNLIVG